MADPWADVRTDPNHGNPWLFEHTDAADGFVGDTVVVAEEDVEALLERLLTDVDALLAVLQDTIKSADSMGHHWLALKIRDALPERLRGETNE